MTKTKQKVERITYHFTREEVIDAIAEKFDLLPAFVSVAFDANGSATVKYEYAETPQVLP